MKITITYCRDCGRAMISWRMYARYAALRGRFTRAHGNGMCNSCYARARKCGTLPHPAPFTWPASQRLDPATLARLRADVGLTERHASGEVTA